MAEDMRVMVVGSGAREHAISEAYERSKKVKSLVVTPGNDFIGYGRSKEVIIDKYSSLTDPKSILAVAEKYRPDLVDVAQDDALAAGTADLLWKHGFAVFGPLLAAAQIEWDKRWSRGFMQRHNIPTPEFHSFTVKERDQAEQYAHHYFEQYPKKTLFIKAAGLCGGKGALKATDAREALARIRQMEQFGEAGEQFVVEEGLEGEEFSYYALSDGKTYRLFKSAQDNKLSHDGDRGEQTGGMGAVAPARVTESLTGEIERRYIAPVFAGLRSEKMPYTGVLYLGGIVTKEGIKTIEYNARWGDPECQVVLPGLTTDYAHLVSAAVDGKLGDAEFVQDDVVRVCVVGAAKGYPGDYSAVTGREIKGLAEAMTMENVSIYGAAVDVRDGKFFADGGRLFSVVGSGSDIGTARSRAYEAMDRMSIDGDNLHFRTDIGVRDLKRHQATR